VAGKPGNPKGSSERARAGTPDLTNVVVGVMMRLTLEVDGKTCVYENVGDCEQPHNWDTDGKRLKDAVSDAKKRCSADAGLGLHLYFKEQKDYVLRAQLNEVSAGPSGGGEQSGQTLVAGNPAGESKDPTAPANPSPAPPEFCDACKAGDCQHCDDLFPVTNIDNRVPCDCPHDDGRPM